MQRTFSVRFLNFCPSYYLHFADVLALVCTEEVLMDLFAPLLIVFNQPLMIEVIEQKYPSLSKQQKSALVDFSSSMFSVVLTMSMIIAPL